jgi:hypothetical protein
MTDNLTKVQGPAHSITLFGRCRDNGRLGFYWELIDSAETLEA